MSYTFSLSDEERLSLELRWYEGTMWPYVAWLLAFAERNRTEILNAVADDAESSSLLNETKRRIVQTGSLDIGEELRDQRREISNELWYRGQLGEHDGRKIQLEWCASHAAAWRKWRVTEYLFVADRCEKLIVDVLSGADSQKPC